MHAGGRVADGDYQRDGRTAPALTVRVLPAPDDGRKRATPGARRNRARSPPGPASRRSTNCCSPRATGHASIDAARCARCSPATSPCWCAATPRPRRCRRRLAAAGIPAVAAGKQSLFATEQAQELLALFDALLQPGDDARLRAALATVLLGLDAHAIRASTTTRPGTVEWQTATRWPGASAGSGTDRSRWLPTCARSNAPRLLALVDGERRLTNLLQLGEALQEADARALGVQGLVDWLRLRIAEADRTTRHSSCAWNRTRAACRS